MDSVILCKVPDKGTKNGSAHPQNAKILSTTAIIIVEYIVKVVITVGKPISLLRLERI